MKAPTRSLGLCSEVPATDWAQGLAPAQLPGPGWRVGGAGRGPRWACLSQDVAGPMGLAGSRCSRPVQPLAPTVPYPRPLQAKAPGPPPTRPPGVPTAGWVHPAACTALPAATKLSWPPPPSTVTPLCHSPLQGSPLEELPKPRCRFLPSCSLLWRFGIRRTHKNTCTTNMFTQEHVHHEPTQHSSQHRDGEPHTAENGHVTPDVCTAPRPRVLRTLSPPPERWSCCGTGSCRPLPVCAARAVDRRWFSILHKRLLGAGLERHTDAALLCGTSRNWLCSLNIAFLGSLHAAREAAVHPCRVLWAGVRPVEGAGVVPSACWRSHGPVSPLPSGTHGLRFSPMWTQQNKGRPSQQPP